MCTGVDHNTNSFCCIGTSRKLLYDKSAKFTASDELPFEDGDLKSSPAVTSALLKADRISPKDETFATDSSWEEDERIDTIGNYTLASDLAVSDAGAQEAVMDTGQEGVVDAAADITKFPSKNDL